MLPRMPSAELDDLLAFAVELADASGARLRERFRAGLEVERKGDASPVTEADREVEALLRGRIAERWPDHGVHGEEHGVERPDAEHLWILDPIDGTRSFVTGNPLFGTLIALWRDGEPLLGVVDHPATGERWVGARGRPTTFRGAGRAEARVRSCAELARAAFCTTAPHFFRAGKRAVHDALHAACAETVYGGDCYLYGLLASGQIDLVVESGLALHDYAAPLAVVQGAGGTMTRWDGRPLGLDAPGDVAAAGDPRVHAAALEAIRRALDGAG